MKTNNGNGNGRNGRKPKLTKARLARLCQALEDGLPQRTACQLAGISHQTWYNYKARAEAGEARYVEIFEAIKAAEAKAEDYLLKIIRNAAESGTWQAAAWILERRHPADYGRNDRLNLKHEGKIETAGDYSQLKELLKDEEFRNLAGQLLARMGGSE